jgi:hypothetical protein
MLPVGSATVHWDSISLWTDLNGNHKVDPGETVKIDSVGGKALPRMADTVGSMWLADNGDLYLVSQVNAILRIPADFIDDKGAIHWDTAKAAWCVDPVIPSCPYVVTGPRQGILGLRVDSRGDLYTCYTYVLPVADDALAKTMAQKYPNLPRTEWQAYATPKIATYNHQGIGHTSESNAVKFAKFDPSGHLLWVAGRKEAEAGTPGEMYHFWNLAGMVGDDYVAGGSEWGQTYFYTSDGFFVDSLFNDPGLDPKPSPYTFGGETSGSRVQYFKRLGQVWAYCDGMAYLVDGFDKNGRVSGETRLWGDVVLDKTYAGHSHD